MSEIDTSADAVERLAAWCMGAPDWPAEVPMPASFTATIAATLRALVRERDAAWQAGAEAMREAIFKQGFWHPADDFPAIPERPT